MYVCTSIYVGVQNGDARNKGDIDDMTQASDGDKHGFENQSR